MMAEAEIELLRRCAGGDNSAFGGIIEIYQDRIYSFAFRLLKDPVAAEEAAQEAFVKAFRGLSSYNTSYPFSSWLFRTAHNACMDALRAGNKNVSLDTEDFPDLPDLSAGVELKVEDLIASERIEAMLGALPPLYSEVLLLAFKENMGPAEIAAVIGAPEGTVKARLFRGRELMKVKLYREAGATF